MAPILWAAGVGYARRVEWPAAFYDRRAGVACPLCDEGRPEATAHAVRFFAGEVSDAYLVRADIVPRYADDPRPGWPFPFPDPDPPAMPEARLMRDVEALRRACA
jgi:hypothetical protein